MYVTGPAEAVVDKWKLRNVKVQTSW